MAERRIDVEERRARLAVRHHLATAAVDDVAEVARSVVALHSTDPASVYLSAWARLRAPRIADVDRALYEDRTVVRMLGMRRTMFVVPAEDAPVIQAACTDAIAIRERGRLEKVVGEAGVARDAGRWLRSLEVEVEVALGARGEATGAELSADVPRLRTRIVLAEGKSYAAEVNVTTRVLFLMASEGRIVRGRPKGSFISSQYRWRLADLPPGPVPSKEEAQARLVRRWLAAFGPGTAADLKWWTGWTLGEVRRALAEVGAVEVELDDGAAGFVLPDDLDPVGFAEAMGRAPAGARPHGDGVAGSRLVPGPARVVAVRPYRERRPHRLVRRPGGRRMDAVRRRLDRVPAARGRRRNVRPRRSRTRLAGWRNGSATSA